MLVHPVPDLSGHLVSVQVVVILQGGGGEIYTHIIPISGHLVGVQVVVILQGGGGGDIYTYIIPDL